MKQKQSSKQTGRRCIDCGGERYSSGTLQCWGCFDKLNEKLVKKYGKISKEDKKKYVKSLRKRMVLKNLMGSQYLTDDE